jgi:hypothetical protein
VALVVKTNNMKTIFILSNESRIVKATRCLDESTLWEAQGGKSIEVELSDYLELSSFVSPDNEVYIQNEDADVLATFEIGYDQETEEHLNHDCSIAWGITNRVIDTVKTFGVHLEDLNLTKDLTIDVMANCETLNK